MDSYVEEMDHGIDPAFFNFWIFRDVVFGIKQDAWIYSLLAARNAVVEYCIANVMKLISFFWP